jgi:hypothetical protein
MNARQLTTLEKFLKMLGENTTNLGLAENKGAFLAERAKTAGQRGLEAVKAAPGATAIGAGGGALAALLGSHFLDDDDEQSYRGY